MNKYKKATALCIKVGSFASFVLDIKCFFNHLWPCNAIVKFKVRHGSRKCGVRNPVIFIEECGVTCFLNYCFIFRFENMQIIADNISDFLIFRVLVAIHLKFLI
jgi:hypothetical protein